MRLLSPFFAGALALLLRPALLRAQGVVIGAPAPDPSAALDVTSTGKGFLPPRLTYAQRTGISNAAAGLLVYQRDNNASPPAPAGYYYYTGTAWLLLQTQGDNLGNGVAQTNVNLNGNKLVGGTQASPSPDGVQLSPSGQVGLGLGAAAPSEQLQVDGGNLKIGRAQWSSAAQDRLLKFGDGSFVTLGETGGDDLLQLQAKEFRFNPSSTSLSGYSGNVGIGLGAAAPVTERLVVSGNVKITGTAGTDGLIFPDGTKQTTAATGGGGSLTLPYTGTASTSSNAFAVSNTGSGSGLYGTTSQSLGTLANIAGVVGEANGAQAVGVLGLTTTGFAVRGIASGSSGVGVFGKGAGSGVYGESAANSGVYGIVTAATLSNVAGVQGVGQGSGNGVLGQSTSGSGVYGSTNGSANGAAGVRGADLSGNSNGTGVYGTSTNGFGVAGYTSTGGNAVYASADGAANALFARADGTGRAGYFTQNNPGNSNPALEIVQKGTGPALKLTGAVNTNNTGSHNMLAVAYGSIDYIYQQDKIYVYNSSDNFTVTVNRNNPGEFYITFAPGMQINSGFGLTVVGTIAGSSAQGFVCQGSSSSPIDLNLMTFRVAASSRTDPTALLIKDWQRFSFVVYSE